MMGDCRVCFMLLTYSMFVNVVFFTEDKIWTVVGHDHLQPISVQGSTPRSPYVLIFNYSISLYHLRSLVASSEYCQQEVTYRCRKSRLFDTWGESCLCFIIEFGWVFFFLF